MIGRPFWRGFLVTLSVVMAGCATSGKKNVTVLKKEQSRRAQAERRVASLQKEISGLKTENGMLAKALERKNLDEPSDPPTLKTDMLSNDPGRQNETMLYQKVVESYKSKDDRGMESMESILRRAYPRSQYLDDVTYLKGMLAFHQGRFTDSLEFLDQVIQQYPHSRKWKDAHLAKALVYKKLNLPDQARAVLESLKTPAPLPLQSKSQAQAATPSSHVNSTSQTSQSQALPQKKKE